MKSSQVETIMTQTTYKNNHRHKTGEQKLLTYKIFFSNLDNWSIPLNILLVNIQSRIQTAPFIHFSVSQSLLLTRSVYQTFCQSIVTKKVTRNYYSSHILIISFIVSCTYATIKCCKLFSRWKERTWAWFVGRMVFKMTVNLNLFVISNWALIQNGR